MTPLTGGLVRLRRLRDGDRPWLTAIEQDAAGGLAHRAGPPTPWSDEDLDAFYERHRDNFLCAIETVDSAEPVGRCILKNHHVSNRHAEIGLVVMAEHRGRGYGTETVALLVDFGFQQWDLHKVKLDVVADNTPAVRVYEKLGFQVDVRRRAAQYRNGAAHDVLDMSLRRGVWEATRGEWVT